MTKPSAYSEAKGLVEDLKSKGVMGLDFFETVDDLLSVHETTVAMEILCDIINGESIQLDEESYLRLLRICSDLRLDSHYMGGICLPPSLRT